MVYVMTLALIILFLGLLAVHMQLMPLDAILLWWDKHNQD